MFDQFDDNTPQSDLDYAHEKECFDIEHERNTAQLLLGLEENTYEYLINEYIPSQGPRDMGLFLDLGMNPTAYIMVKCLRLGEFREEFRNVIIAKLKDEYGYTYTT